jgi:hypothetical protein
MAESMVLIVAGVVAGTLATLLILRALSVKRGTAVERRSSNKENIASLRQNLRVKVMYDEATIDRLIELEREKTPNASLAQLMRNAIDRWERDNNVY